MLIRLEKKIVLAVLMVFCTFISGRICYARVYSPGTRVIIFDFEAIDMPESFAKTFTEITVAKIVKKRIFTVIDRKYAMQIMKEQEFQNSGCTSQECRAKLGQLLNAEKIMYGSISRMLDFYIITIKIVDVGKGNIEWSDSVKIPDIKNADKYIDIYLEKISRDENIDDDLFVKKKTLNNDDREDHEHSGRSPVDHPFERFMFKKRNYWKSSWYIGFGMGTGRGDLVYKNGDRKKIEKMPVAENAENSNYDDSPGTFNFGAGMTVNSYFNVGFDVSSIYNKTEFLQGEEKTDASLNIINYLIIITFFPMTEGIFLRYGGGFTSARLKNYELGDEDYTYSGKAFLVGAGYAFRMGKNFNLCLNMDYTRQYYQEKLDKSNFINMYMSFYWF